VPYSALTKAVTSGLVASTDGVGLPGFALLPVSVMASAVGMIAFIFLSGWWRYATRTSRGVPIPTRWTFASGACTAGIIATTTIAYTFDGVSIVFVMLLMRGGVLILAPIVDAASGRRTRWYSWVGLALSMAALVVAFAERGGYALTLLCGIDIGLYLASYFVRLRIMSYRAKTKELAVNRRYFVEEQLVAAPLLLVVVAIWASLGVGEIGTQLRMGFTDLWGTAVLPAVIMIGLFSQGTGIFGSLVFLDARENTYCVPVNRASSILAGVVASFALHIFLDQAAPSAHKLVGAGLIVLAILALTLGPAWTQQREREAKLSPSQ